MMRIAIGLIVHDRHDEFTGWFYHHLPFADELIIIADRSDYTDIVGNHPKVTLIRDDRGYQTIRLRDQYLQAAKDKQVDWLLRMDVDERISLEAGYQLRTIAENAEAAGINFVEFEVGDVIENLDGTTRVAFPDFSCPNFFKVTPEARYVGEHHEGVDLGISPKHGRLPAKYFHIRSEASIKLRGARNFFATPRTTGGHEAVAEWEEFKGMCAWYGFTEFSDFVEYLKKGQISSRLKEFFIRNRNAENCELRALFEVYFVLLHPEENSFYAGNQDFPFDPTRQSYQGDLSF